MNIHTSDMYGPFEEYIELLVDKGYASTTVEQYAGHVSRFLDFLYEVRAVSAEMDVAFEPSKVFRLYQDYLTLGQNSNTKLISQVAINIGKDNETSFKSIANGIEASLSIFMELRMFDKDDHSFLDSIKHEHNIDHRELSQMARNSWFEATKRNFGSKSQKKVKLFRRAAKKNNRTSLKTLTKEKIRKSFPIDKSVQFFYSSDITPASKFSKVRDFLFYSLLASTGVRTSEALQVTVDDINWDEKTIDIISPNERHNTGLTQKESEALCDKGRATSLTFMIQPFAHIFWSILKIYMERHYKANVSHRFLFQKANGRPFFCSCRSSRSKTLKRYIKAFDPALEHLGHHSFRHTYAFYTLNYFPIVDEHSNPTDRQGLPMAYVKLLMGHQNISSTEVYAKQDIDLIEFVLSAANSFVRDQNISLQDLAIQYFDRQLRRLEAEKEKLEETT
ncbi:tyrosine-type recombinase/integrase [Vibrio splendidus]|uniref:site-specific integrase n=1 Tax=Vibrio splendidus TaxID=29497 RepID=UPI000D35A1C6|nr:site-specific integrase [Vibrio splendidus]PTQ10612.1 site-specific integrase [Vibrio splendidus]